MEFISLNTIINDLLNVVRGSKLNASEPISKRQIESWIHQYRALLLKRDLDKGKQPNVNYTQVIPTVELIKEDKATSASTLTTGIYLYRTTIEIPKALDLNHSYGILSVTDILGNEIQIVPESKVSWQSYKRYTKGETLAFLKNNYIYIVNPKGIKYIAIRGVFENPVSVYELVNPMTTQRLATYDDPYPVPMDIIPALKELILNRELGIEVVSPSDIKNDSKSEFSSNIKQ